MKASNGWKLRKAKATVENRFQEIKVQWTNLLAKVRTASDDAQEPQQSFEVKQTPCDKVELVSSSVIKANDKLDINCSNLCKMSEEINSNKGVTLDRLYKTLSFPYRGRIAK